MIKAHIRLWKLAICACITTTANGQKVYKYNLPGQNCYSEIRFEEISIAPVGVILLDAKGKDIHKFAQQNSLLASNKFEGYNFLYVNILEQGTSSKNECYEVLVRTMSNVYSINPNVFYLIENQIVDTFYKQNKEQDGPNFKIIRQDLNNITNVLNDIAAKTNQAEVYRVPENYFVTDWEYRGRLLNYRRNFDVGVFFTPVLLTGPKIGLTKDVLGTYGLSFMKNIGKRHALKIAIGGCFKMPNKKSIQSGMQSQMMSAIQNEQDSMFLDMKLSGHVYLGGELSYRYHFNAQKQFRPFVGIGIGSYMVTSIAGRMLDTIDISDVDMSNPSSMQDKFNQDDDAMDMSQNKYSFISPMAEVGFEYKATPGIKFAVSMPVRYNIEQSKTLQNSLSIGFNLGVSFTMNAGKLPKNMRVKNK